MIFDQLRESLPKLVNHVSNDTGDVFSSTTIIHGLRVRLKQRIRKIVKVNGSFHRYFTGGANNTLFTFNDLNEAVDRMSTELGFQPWQAEIQHLEFGVNIPADNPEDLIDAAILYMGYPPTKRKQGRRQYYKEWTFSEYVIKLYRKGPFLVRFEIRMFRTRKLDEVNLITLADIIKYDKFCYCLEYLKALADHFFFVPNDVDLIPEDMRTDWALYRNDQYWKGLKKWTKTRRKIVVQEAITRLNLTDWISFFKEGIIAQGALMTENRDATYSSLGLLAETVAGHEEVCDRKVEDGVKVTITVCIHPAVANVRWNTDVIISVPSYHPLLPRGPPSLLSLFLLLMYAYSVALPIPVVASMSLIGMVPASYRASACSMALGLALGLPPFRPRARAAASPSIVRSCIRSRSN